MPIKGMLFYHVNTRSLFSKLTQLDLLYNDSDVLCCSETWLDNRFPDALVDLPGKKLFRLDRRNNISNSNARPTAGGVCIYLKNIWANYSFMVNECSQITKDFEIMTVVTARPDHRKFVTICVYKPPKGKLSACIDYLNIVLARRDISRMEIWILGDFNTDLLKRNDIHTVALQAFAKKKGLTQCINSVTRPNVRGGSCIDLIMTNSLFINVSGTVDDMIADHYTVYCIRKKRKDKKVVTVETVRDFKAFNAENFRILITDIDWSEFDSDLNPARQWSYLYNSVVEIMSIMCPLKKVHSRKPRRNWITMEIYRLIRERKNLIKNLKTARDPQILLSIRISRNLVNAAVRKAKENYIKAQLLSNRKDPKKFWRTIKSVFETENIDDINIRFNDPDTGVEIQYDQSCDFVNRFFASISDRICNVEDARVYIPGDKIDTVFDFMPPERFDIMRFAEEIDINSSSGIMGINARICKILLLHIPDKFRTIYANSMFSGIFPADWTIATVKLLPKSGDLSNPGNWRPISMTNIFSKILEKLVHLQMLRYLFDNALINENQFGFLPGKSTHEAIFRTVQHLYNALNCKKLTGLLLLDMAKAFNCIDHNILFVKMEKAGFALKVINWFKSYLNRSQKVKLENRFSATERVNKGIAQGTVLGPILFIFYINDIFSCIKHVKMSLFADDCVIYLSGNNWDLIHRKMQTDFDAIIEWSFRNSLRLNCDKTKAMVVSTRGRIFKLNNPKRFKMYGRELSFVKKHLYLGIMLDSTMSLSYLVKDIKKKISNRIFGLRKLRRYLTFDAAVLVYKQTILPIIDYAGFLLVTCNKEDRNDFQKLQNDVLRICTMSRLADKVSIVKLHAKCKIISLEQRMRKQLLWLMFILSRDKGFLKVPNRVTRTIDRITFKVPARITPVYERSPYYLGTLLWNELDKTIQEAPNVYAFKKEINRQNRTYKMM